MLIRRERADDVAAIHTVTAEAFSRLDHSAPPVADEQVPGEATLVSWLRADDSWIPELSLVAIADDEIIGHVVCTRGSVGNTPALGLGPISVRPSQQGLGVGSALIHAVLGAADTLNESIVCLLGDPTYYARFGFTPARIYSIDAPDPAWGEHFQARPLTGYDNTIRGRFAYAAPFDRLGG